MPSTKRPSRSCRSAKHPPARSAFSTILDLVHELLELPNPVHSRETSLSSLNTPLTASCHSSRLICNGTFQCRSINEPANPQDRSSGRSGQGSRSSSYCLVVVVVSLFAVLGRCVVQRSTRRRLVFVFRSRVASPRGSRSPARPVRPLLSASVISRIAPGGCLVVVKNKSEFFALLRERTRFFFISAFWSQILYPWGALSINETRKTAHFKNGRIGSTIIPDAPPFSPLSAFPAVRSGRTHALRNTRASVFRH